MPEGEIVASIVHSPQLFAKIYKKEFLEKINEKSVNYYPQEDAHGYNFKRRLKKARSIPASFVKEDNEGGYTVLSQSLKRRHWRWDRTKYHYHVYKTRNNFWICSCTDFAFFNPRPCKHIIRAILYKNGFTEEHDKKLQERVALCLSDEIRNIEGVFDI